MTMTPADYIQDHGLDWTAIEDIAAKGPSDADEDFCTECGLDPAELAAYCRERMAVESPNDLDCDKCDETAKQYTCDDCGETAMLTNCGHFTQPRPIAASGHRTLCEDCAGTE